MRQLAHAKCADQFFAPCSTESERSSASSVDLVRQKWTRCVLVRSTVVSGVDGGSCARRGVLSSRGQVKHES